MQNLTFSVFIVVLSNLIAFSTNAEEVKTQTTITSVQTETIGEITSLSVDQLVSAMVNLNGKELRSKGTLGFTWMDELVFETIGGTRIGLELDDGRSVSKRALLCNPTPCNVELMLELQISHYSGTVSLDAIGYDVVFLDDN